MVLTLPVNLCSMMASSLSMQMCQLRRAFVLTSNLCRPCCKINLLRAGDRICNGKRYFHVSGLARRNQDKDHNKSQGQDSSLMEAAREVAETLPGSERETFEDLMNQLNNVKSKVDIHKEEPRLVVKKSSEVPEEKEKQRIEGMKSRFMIKPKQGLPIHTNQKPTEPLTKARRSTAAAPSDRQQEVLDKSHMTTEREETADDYHLHGSTQRKTTATESDGRSGRGRQVQFAKEFESFDTDTYDSRSLIYQIMKEKLPTPPKERVVRRTNRNRTQRSEANSSHDSSVSDKQLATNKSAKGGNIWNGVKPLEIFNSAKWSEDNHAETLPMLQSWQDDYQKLLDEYKYYPSNGFEEMIQWTKEGKTWHYPIDNEQGMEAEKQVPFYEHVFLDKHLSAFPSEGPVRRFMELVILGLGKNACLTVAEKVEHIKWYEEYFRKKQSVVTTEKLLAEQSSTAV